VLAILLVMNMKKKQKNELSNLPNQYNIDINQGQKKDASNIPLKPNNSSNYLTNQKIQLHDTQPVNAYGPSQQNTSLVPIDHSNESRNDEHLKRY